MPWREGGLGGDGAGETSTGLKRRVGARELPVDPGSLLGKVLVMGVLRRCLSRGSGSVTYSLGPRGEGWLSGACLFMLNVVIMKPTETHRV